MISNSVKSQEQPVVIVASSAADGAVNSTLNFEVGNAKPGVHEVLGHYHRISAITFILFITTVFLSLSAMCLYLTVDADYKWQRIISGEGHFPNLTSKSKRKTYFEGKKINDTAVGQLIQGRRKWQSLDVEFGFDRHTSVQLTLLVIMLSIVLFCLVHLISACCCTSCRRKFQLISLSYGFVSLFVFTLCFTTLYVGFVHKVAAYLENAQKPPDDVNATSDNLTVHYFINMSYACAFAFSVPNSYVKEEYSGYTPFPEDSSFTIEGVTYSKQDMMDLGICPRQDYLLISAVLLTLTTVCSCFASSYSEFLENEIIGPPVWLQRFRVKVHKGIRHWQTRKKIPSYVHEDGVSTSGESRDNDDSRTMEMGFDYFDDSATYGDVYDILDGGLDHIMLLDPFNRGANKHKLYRSTTTIISVMDLRKSGFPR